MDNQWKIDMNLLEMILGYKNTHKDLFDQTKYLIEFYEILVE